MMMTSRLGASAVLLAATLALTAGCATSRRQNYLHDKASAHVYDKPLAEVWPYVKALLEEDEYSLIEAKDGYEIQTDWVMQGAPSSLGTSWARYLVRGYERAPGKSAVEFLKQSRVQSQPPNDSITGMPAERESPSHPGTDTNVLGRDREMEWKLLQRVDSEAAKALEAEAAQQVQP